MNQVNLFGRLGKEPEVIQLENGNKVAKISVATSETYKKKDTGEKSTNTEWHNVVCYGKQAEIIEKYFKKGDQILLNGKIQYKSYEKDGQTRYVTNIVLNSFHFVGGNSQADNQNSQQTHQAVPVGPENDDLPF